MRIHREPFSQGGAAAAWPFLDASTSRTAARAIANGGVLLSRPAPFEGRRQAHRFGLLGRERPLWRLDLGPNRCPLVLAPGTQLDRNPLVHLRRGESSTQLRETACPSRPAAVELSAEACAPALLTAVPPDKSVDANRFDVAVIGAGPRGLAVLERLQAILDGFDLREAVGDVPITLHVIDPHPPGEGVHTALQPDHLLLNTQAGDISVWGVRVPGAEAARRDRPSFLEWVRAAGYRIVDGDVVRARTGGRAVGAHDFLPRRLLGEYLHACYARIVRSLKESTGIEVIHHATQATDLTRLGEARYQASLEDGGRLAADYAVLCTGQNRVRPGDADRARMHAASRARTLNPHARFVWDPYPLANLDTIAPEATVAVRGMGLTAHDVLAQLTAGRGGRFVQAPGGGLNYEPSGDEPNIIMFSRRGFPFDVRARNEKAAGEAFEPAFFTRGAIDRARDRRRREGGSEQLDLHTDLLPLLRKEMCYAYYRCALPEGARAIDPARYVPGEEEAAAVEALLAPPAADRFRDGVQYADELVRRMEEDLVHARAGNRSDPMKAAAAVLRDTIDVLRYAVDYSGLTPESHARFFDEFFDLVVGQHAGAAPLIRGEQLLALIRAGIVRLGPGPDPDVDFDEARGRFVLRSARLEHSSETAADVLIRAQIDGGFPKYDESPLIGNMLASGMVRPYRNGEYRLSGIEVDGRHHVVDADSNVHASLAAAGFVTEGPNFFTFVLPGPGLGGRVETDASQIAADVVAKIVRRHAQLPAAELTHRRPESVTPAHVHPEKRRGKTVYIHQPTDPAEFPQAELVLLPGEPVPAELNGVAFSPWQMPGTVQEWVDRSGKSLAVDRAVPYPQRFAENRFATAGVVLLERGKGPLPYVWLVVPTNFYGARLSLIQGRVDVDKNEPLAIAGLRESGEETGFEITFDAVIGHYGSEYDPTPAHLRAPASNNVRYLLGHRIGGDGRPGYETQALVLMRLDHAIEALPRPRDRVILADVMRMIENARTRGAWCMGTSALPVIRPGTHIPGGADLARKAMAFRAMHHADRPLLLPNAWDAGSARSIVEAGLPAVATSSAAVARSLGYPDGEAMPASEMLGVARRIADTVPVPVTVDMEAGYGMGAAELVDRLLEAGAVGLNLEDTDHDRGGLVDAGRQADWLHAVAEARDQSGVPIVLNARIDVFQQGHGQSPAALVEETVRRARDYLAAGADCVYPHLVRGESTIAQLLEGIDGPTNFLYWPGVPSPQRLGEMGVARISLGRGVRRAADQAARAFVAEFAGNGAGIDARRTARWTTELRNAQQLVVQGRYIPDRWLEELLGVSQGEGALVRLSPGSRHDDAFRILDVRRGAALLRFLEDARDRMGIDFFVGAAWLASQLKALLADVDGTLIEGDFQLAMAQFKGLLDDLREVRNAHWERVRVSRQAFADSMREQFAMLAMAREDLDQVYRSIPPAPGRARLFRALKERGVALAAATGGLDYVPLRLAGDLQLDYVRGNAAQVVGGWFTGRLLGTFVDGQAKGEALMEIAERLALWRDRRSVFAAVGDGPGERAVFEAANALVREGRIGSALNIAYHAVPELEALATAVIRHAGLDAILNLFIDDGPERLRSGHGGSRARSVLR